MIRLFLNIFGILGALSLITAVLLYSTHPSKAGGGIPSVGVLLPSLPASSLPSVATAPKASPPSAQDLLSLPQPILTQDSLAPLAGAASSGAGTTTGVQPNNSSPIQNNLNNQTPETNLNQGRNPQISKPPGTFVQAWQTQEHFSGTSSGQVPAGQTPNAPETFDRAWQTNEQIPQSDLGPDRNTQTSSRSGTFDQAWRTNEQIQQTNSDQTPPRETPNPSGTFDQAWNVKE